MYFSVIIINYKTKNLTKNCINSICKYFDKKDYELILVDNASNDKSGQRLKDIYGEKINFIFNKNNLGFGRANNQAAKIAKGEYLFFLNSDTIIKSNILKIINKEFEQDKKIGILSPRLILENGEEQKYAYGEFPKVFNLFFNKIKNKKVKDAKSEIITDWVSGAAMAIRKDIFDKVGGFDEEFFMYFEDIDLCKRIKALGYKVVYFKKASLIHLGGASRRKISATKREYYKSQNYYYKKHLGFLKMFLMRLIRFPYKSVIMFINRF